MNCFWEGFFTLILGVIGILVYLGFFAGAGYFLGRLSGRDHDECAGFILVALIIAIILGIGVIGGLAECGIINS